MALPRAPRSIAGKLLTAAAVGAVTGGAPVLLLDPTAPFAVYGSLLLAGVGALAVGTGVGAGLAVGGPSLRGRPRPWTRELLAAALVGGAIAMFLLTAVSSTVVVLGGVLAALLCAGLTGWLDARDGADSAARLVP